MRTDGDRTVLNILGTGHHLPVRQPQENIPPTRAEREKILEGLRAHLERNCIVPPLPMDELRREAEAFLDASGVDRRFLDYTAVLLSNEIWRESLAPVPFNRRLLLLPKCLRVEDHCPAPFDEFGLLCKKCGMCSIQDLQEEAEKLGYAVLVAEGSPIVMAIVETGKIEAIVGVSCLNVLEKVYPYMEAAAIPGVAIPLLQDDCRDTNVDLEWVWDAIHLTSDDRTRRLDLGSLREEVDTWFSRESLADILGKPAGETEEIGHDWLARAGKRWRPFLTVAIHRALSDEPGGEIPADLRKIAVAVECFHKASLIHDDIEDADAVRYGEATLHESHGVPVALNVGDYLIGEGYRMIAECDAPPEARAEMLLVASRGHRTLSLGQGSELCWSRSPKPLKPRDVLDIFRRKTAPAFEVALQLGLIHAGGDDALAAAIRKYSESLGIAYQVRDDLDDFEGGSDSNDVLALRPTLPLSLAHEKASGEQKETLRRVWCREVEASAESLYPILDSLGVLERVREVLEACKEEAIRALKDVENPNVKGLLRRVIGKIFNDLEIKGWCNEFEARNAPGGEVGAQAAG